MFAFAAILLNPVAAPVDKERKLSVVLQVALAADGSVSAQCGRLVACSGHRFNTSKMEYGEETWKLIFSVSSTLASLTPSPPQKTHIVYSFDISDARNIKPAAAMRMTSSS